MAFQVEHQCPQCGATVQLEDADRVLTCAFCGVSHLLHTPQYHRFTLPVRYDGKDLLWVPYLHFKGSAFVIEQGEVKERVLHVSAPGAPSVSLPPSLGFRSQTQKLKFLKSTDAGDFLRFSARPSELLKGALIAAGAQRHGQPAYIGETACLIYLPLTRAEDGRYLDGVTGHPLSQEPSFDPPLVEPPAPDLTVLPALCPGCGGGLMVSPQAVAYPCANCAALWEWVGGQLVKRAIAIVDPKPGLQWLPFWVFPPLQEAPATWGELADTTGQPLALRQPSAQAWAFWCPAFKVRPRTLLRLAERVSLAPPFVAREPESPAAVDLQALSVHPITLPSREAGEMLPVALASMTFTVLARAVLFNRRTTLGAPTLVYLPFATEGMDLVNRTLQLAINIGALGFGDSL
ncbi:MAG: hypothetical protein SF187_04115 [Deltaproteobacteria bacterium]|nr:hypothetical protein [Deltaproteobacteria bacterium]